MSLLTSFLFTLLALVPFIEAAAPAASTITLQNDYVALTFDNATLALQSIHSLLHTPPYPLTSLTHPNTDWWSATLITNTSHYTISPSTPHAATAAYHTADRLELLWQAVAVGGKQSGLTVDVAVSVVLPAGSRWAEFRYRVVAPAGSVVGLWSFTYSISQLPTAQSESDDDDMFVLNNSFGALYTKPLLSHPDAITEIYPSGGATYQFLAHYHVVNATDFPPTHPGLYVATHDPAASYKLFGYQSDAATGSLTLSVELRPPNNNLPFTAATGEQRFSTVVGVFRGDWWDAAQLYRNWSLTAAPWARRTIRERGASFPTVMKRAQVWINTGWQGHDVFNATQGNPDVVLARATAIAKRFNLQPQQLAMHWYVFQASNKFDAYYPVYFPVKAGFTEAVERLQSEGITVAPYVNGRIYDIDLPKWRDDDAQRFAAKSTPPQLGFNLSLYCQNSTSDSSKHSSSPSNSSSCGSLLTFHPTVSFLCCVDEDYGNGVQQAAMCPYTAYWQQTYRNVTSTLAHTHTTHAIYIDQIGAAAAQPCYDPTHNHTLGDGTAWVEGYHTFLQGVLAAVGPSVAIVTESNAEPYMGDLHGYLTLTAFEHSVATRDGQLIGVFPAVYGGYMVPFGAIFTVDDLVNHTDSGYATLLAAQFVHGAQLGWMSLGGTSDDPPMGLYGYLMSSTYDAEVAWLTRLAGMRAVVSDYFLYGREMRQPPFKVTNITYNPTNSSSPASTTVPFLTSAWLLYNTTTHTPSLLITLVIPDSTIARSGLHWHVDFNMTDYGLPLQDRSAARQWEVRWMSGDGVWSRVAWLSGGSVVWLDGSLSGRTMLMLMIDLSDVTDDEVAGGGTVSE